MEASRPMGTQLNIGKKYICMWTKDFTIINWCYMNDHILRNCAWNTKKKTYAKRYIYLTF